MIINIYYKKLRTSDIRKYLVKITTLEPGFVLTGLLHIYVEVAHSLGVEGKRGNSGVLIVPAPWPAVGPIGCVFCNRWAAGHKSGGWGSGLGGLLVHLIIYSNNCFKPNVACAQWKTLD